MYTTRSDYENSENTPLPPSVFITDAQISQRLENILNILEDEIIATGSSIRLLEPPQSIAHWFSERQAGTADKGFDDAVPRYNLRLRYTVINKAGIETDSRVETVPLANLMEFLKRKNIGFIDVVKPNINKTDSTQEDNSKNHSTDVPPQNVSSNQYASWNWINIFMYGLAAFLIIFLIRKL